MYFITDETEEGGEVEEEKEVMYHISSGLYFTSIKMNRYVPCLPTTVLCCYYSRVVKTFFIHILYNIFVCLCK